MRWRVELEQHILQKSIEEIISMNSWFLLCKSVVHDNVTFFYDKYELIAGSYTKHAKQIISNHDCYSEGWNYRFFDVFLKDIDVRDPNTHWLNGL